MTQEQFATLMQPIFEKVSGASIDTALETELNTTFPPQSKAFKDIEAACHAAISQGWMCAQGGPGRRFGRVIEAAQSSGTLSVDVVDLTDIVGPHHVHPTGEVCMVMPVDDGAQFDGHGAGWCVNPPGSDHFPTVTDGRALVLYLLPEGRIEFTGRSAAGA